MYGCGEQAAGSTGDWHGAHAARHRGAAASHRALRLRVSVRRRLGSRKRAERHPLYHRREQFVTVCGEITSCIVEVAPDPERIDHVWIEVAAGADGPLRLSLTSTSLKSRAAGLDPRVRVGIVTSSWSELPAAGVRAAESFDYSAIEAQTPVSFVAFEREEVEDLLRSRATRAVWVRAWGDLYARDHAGVHQIHSRRASRAVPVDLRGRDGAVQFFYSEARSCELLLLKFAGQP